MLSLRWLTTGLVIAFLAGLATAELATAAAPPAAPVIAAAVDGADAGVVADAAGAEPLAKKCSFNSDCPYGKCNGGLCGGCSFNSDCKGWGNCKGGFCGGCSFNSDCKGFGSCNQSRCTNSPY